MAALVKQGKLYFSKVVKYKGEGKPTLSMRRFPLSLFIYPKLMEFRAAPKKAVQFHYGAAIHRGGGATITPETMVYEFGPGVRLWDLT